MQLERVQRQAVIEQTQPLLEELERIVLGLSPNDAEAQGDFTKLLDRVQTIRMSCAALREFDEITSTLTSCEKLLHALEAKQVAQDEKIGALLLQCVNTFRYAINHIGNSGVVAGPLAKVLSELRRVILGQVEKKAASKPSSPVDDYRIMFLDDREGFFSKLSQFQKSFSERGLSALADRLLLEEFFRVIHTLKGNASALGFEELFEVTHAIEDLLQLIHRGILVCDDELLSFFFGCCIEVRNSRTAYLNAKKPAALSKITSKARSIAGKKRKRESASPFTAKSTQFDAKVPSAQVFSDHQGTGLNPLQNATQTNKVPYFLSVLLAGRKILIPCESVAEILRKPRVLALPCSRDGWLGVISVGGGRYSQGGLVPLVESEAGPHANWVVVLTHPGANPDEQLVFSVPVDEISGVVEFSEVSEEDSTTVLDLKSIVEKVSVDQEL
ncbi:MAG: Hpt domain-containing protein [Bdellovibrionota bacterium]